MGREYVEELKTRVLSGGAEITYNEALKLAHEDWIYWRLQQMR